MAVVQVPFLVAVLLLVSPGLHCSSPLPACPESCTCQRAPLLNCSSSGLSSVPQHIQDSVAELDLSQNRLDTVTLHRPYRNLRNVRLENNTITRLSLCIDKNLGTQSVRGRHSGQLGPLSRRRCVSWAPALQLLSVERNQLIQLPEGLEGSASLWVLQLSFNRISTLRPGELRHLRQLKELHLKHNLITNLHPQMFQDLTQLRVLDLSFNMLTNLHPSMYLSLRSIGSDVRLDGNRWQCDCSMRSLRRRMAYDSNRGLQTWGVVCAFPSVLSGKDLLQLEEDDLNCFGTENGPELHRDVTVYSGSEILLSCSKQDSSWLTPSGQESVSRPQAPLFIGDVTDKDTGLYVCMTEDHEVVSVFNLQISRVEHARRKTRSLPRASRQVIPHITTNRIGQERNQSATQSDLTLAVCLSVFITFLIAFILGVLARPFIDILCKKVTNKRSPSATNSVSSAEQRQYENEAYSEGEEPDEIVTHRERRVKFSTGNIGQDINVEYYDTVASGNQQSVEAAKTEEDEHTAGVSGSENGSRQINPENNQRDARDISGTTDTRRKVHFDHIPDSEKLEERSLSSCSDSSLSDRELKKDRMNKRGHTSTKSLQRAEDSVQQGADSSTSEIVEVEELSIERTSEIPEFSTDSGLCQADEEQFDFSDSVGSNSARSSSLFSSFNDSKRKVLPTSDIQSRDDVSSGSSSLSEDEPTQYTVNPDQEEEDTENNHNKSDLTNTCLKQDASFQQQISGVDTSKPPVGFNQGNYPHDTLRPAERPEQTFSSQSSDSEQMQNTVNEKVKKGEVTEYYKPSSRVVAGERDTREKIKPMPRSKWRGVSLGVTSFGKSLDPKAPSPPTAYSSSSSSESDAEITDRKVKHNKVRKSKKYLDINAPFSASNSSSSDETRDDPKKHTKKKQQEEYQSGASKDRCNATYPEWPNQTTSPCNDSSSSDGSADQIMDHMQKKGEMHMTSVHFQKSHTASHDSDTQWPALDLENTTRIKRRLDIKAPSPSPDSYSSSDSEDETTGHTEKKRPQKVDHSGLLLKESQTATHGPDVRWPALDLENIPTIKRRLDVKAPSPPSDSSSSSESEDETTHLTKRPGKVNISQIKKHYSSSSSSSESDDETTGRTEKKIPLKFYHSGLLLKESQTANLDPDARWPALDLENIPTIKRRLDIKAPSPHPDSSSSNDSGNEPTNHKEKQNQGDTHMAKNQIVVSQTQWPALDLEHTTPIKRRLDIKAPSPPPDSSSSSDSDDETTHAAERPGKVGNAVLQLQKISTATHDPDARWPALDLENIPTIKRRLDVKAPSPPPDSSSNSDSEDETTHLTKRPGKVDISQIKKHDSGSSSSSESDDETTGHTEEKRPLKFYHSGLLLKESQTANHDPDLRWPALDLEHIPTIKRRLDVKAPSPSPDSSSSSNSEDETTGHTEKKRPLKIYYSGLLLKESQTANLDTDAKWPALDLENIPTIKRRLDIKASSPPPDSSSSSESDDETIHAAERPGKVGNAALPLQKFQTATHDQDARWPAKDLEHIPTINRRLDVKAPSKSPDSSTNSDSDNETTGHTEKKRPQKVDHSGLLLKQSQTATHDPDVRWPALDLEHIPTIKRRLDVKAPSPSPDSSSSSDSEDETTGHTEKKRPLKIYYSGLLLKESQTANLDTDAKWPALDLENIPTIKRRLDIKAPSPPPDSSSSSDSDDETTHAAERPGKVSNATVPLQKFPTATDDQDARWPAKDLENIPTIKRRLDVKAPSPHPDSSSSSDSEDETTGHTEKKRPQKVDHSGLLLKQSQTATHDPDVRWPALDLENIPTIKRRLDIAFKYQRTTTTSSDNWRRSSHTVKHETDKDGVRITTQEQQKVMHNINLGIPNIRRRLDIKAPSPQPDLVLDSTSTDVRQSESNSSTSESEDENRDHKFKWSTKSPLINISSKPKTEHTIKLEKYTVITDDLRDKPTNDDISPTPEINPELQSRWDTMNLGVSRFRKRLDITSHRNVPPNLLTSPLPDSPSSYTGESGTGNKSRRTRLKNHLVKVTEEKSNPDTQLTGFGTPRARRYLDTKVREKAPGTSPLHQQSDSLSSSESEGISTEYAGYRWRGTSQMSVVPDVAALQNSTSLLVTHAADESRIGTQVERKAGVELKIQASEEEDVSDSMWRHLSLTNIPHVKRASDISAPLQRESFSSSNSEDETDHTVPELKPGVPRINRRLNIKAPSPEPNTSSSSSSESDNEVTGYSAKQSLHSSDMTDDYSQIAYKRSIIKAPRQRKSFSASGRSHTSDHPVAQAGLSHRVDDRIASQSRWGVSSIEQQSTIDVPPEIRWTGLGRNLPDFSSTSRHLDLGLPPPLRTPPAELELTPQDSSNSSDKIKQDRVKAYESLMHRFSYPTAGRVSVASSRSLDKFDNTSRSKNEIFRALSEDREEKKGLGALKAISSKRHQWDTEDKDKDAV